MENTNQVEIFYNDSLLVVHGLDAALAAQEESNMSGEERKDSFRSKVAVVSFVALEMARVDPDGYGGSLHFSRLVKQVRERMSVGDRKLFDDAVQEFHVFMANYNRNACIA